MFIRHYHAFRRANQHTPNRLWAACLGKGRKSAYQPLLSLSRQYQNSRLRSSLQAKRGIAASNVMIQCRCQLKLNWPLSTYLLSPAARSLSSKAFTRHKCILRRATGLSARPPACQPAQEGRQAFAAHVKVDCVELVPWCSSTMFHGAFGTACASLLL